MSKARDLANAGTALTTVSATELGYLDGVTSAVQTQINAQIPKSTVTTKGDILAATGSGTIVRQGVGTNGQLLSADSAEADGLKWIDAPSSAATIAQIASGSLSGSTVSLTGLTADKLYLRLEGAKWATSNAQILIRFNSNSSALYNFVGGSAASSGNVYNLVYLTSPTATTGFSLSGNQYNIDNAAGLNAFITIENCKSTGFTTIQFNSTYNNANDGGVTTAVASGIFLSATQVTSLQIVNGGSYSFNAGTYTLWGG